MADDAAITEQCRPRPLLDGPILPTLVGLAIPNVIALSVQSLVVIAETSYIGLLGTEALAAMALVFPMIMLTQMLSSGAIGGGVSSAISRALGSGDTARAKVMAMHALAIGLGIGVVLSALLRAFGPALYRTLGGSGAVLEQAAAYSSAFFTGAITIWLFNSLVSIVRGTGNMRLPSSTIIAVGLLQIVCGAALSLGLGPFPRFGISGVAIGQVVAYGVGAIFLIWWMTRRHARLRLSIQGVTLLPEMFRDILKVGAVACFSPIQSIVVVIILARFASAFGTEALAGFSIGVRLELLLVPIAFAIGVACVPMVGMAIGANNIARARRVAWTGALLSGGLIGAIGLIIALKPALWGRIFSSDPEVLAAASTYLSIAGIGFPAYGIGLCLYFASQGSGKILGPVLAGTVRLAVVIAGGFWLVATNGTFADLASLVACAMLAYGMATASAVRLTRWGKN